MLIHTITINVMLYNIYIYIYILDIMHVSYCTYVRVKWYNVFGYKVYDTRVMMANMRGLF